MSHVPEMQRFVEHLQAPGWELGGTQGFGPSEHDRYFSGGVIDRDEAVQDVTDTPFELIGAGRRQHSTARCFP